MHDDELVIDSAVVRALLNEQFPQARGLPVTRLRTPATVNAVFRVGESLSARLRLRPMAADAARSWLAAEAAAQQEFADVSPFPTPVPVGIGGPGHGYPLPFTVQTWVPGTVPRVGQDAGSASLADDLARLIGALRAAPTRGHTFAGAERTGRGGHLPNHDEWVEGCIRRNAPWVDPVTTARMWSRMRELPREDADVMCHGDLVPGNVLSERRRLVGVLDGGGYGPADPALDLVAAWHLLDAARRDRLRTALGSSDLEWARGQAWAFEQAMGLVHYYATSNPPMHALGLRTMRELMAQPW